MIKFWVEDIRTGRKADFYDVASEFPNLCQCDLEGFAVTDEGRLLVCDECGNFEYVWDERYVVHEGENHEAND